MVYASVKVLSFIVVAALANDQSYFLELKPMGDGGSKVLEIVDPVRRINPDTVFDTHLLSYAGL